MSYGRYKHDSYKVAKASDRVRGSSSRGLTVDVKVFRAVRGDGKFNARACVRSSKNRHQQAARGRCSSIVSASSPTAATKRALTELAKGLK